MKLIGLIAGGFFIGLGAAGAASSFVLTQIWVAAAPLSPSSSLGLIYPHNEHGSITFLSAFQSTSSSLLLPASMMIFMIGGAMSPTVWRNGKAVASAPISREGWWGLGAGVLVAPALIGGIGAPIVHALNQAGIVMR